MTKLRSRYPGLRPFDEGEGQFFFGRTEEIEAVCRLLDLEKLIILHGPSGMGKSSLINAGILPVLSNVRRWDIPYHVVTIRLTNYDPEFARMRRQAPLGQSEEEIIQDPVDRFVHALLGEDPPAQTLIPLPKESLWLRAKQCLVEQDISPLRLIVVLDQFEELFSYPENRVEEFARQLSELYHQVMPESVRRGLERKQVMEEDLPAEGASLPSEAEEKLLQSLEEPLDVKMLISMRSDKLHYLDRLRPYLPEMMLNSFELRSFQPEQAKEALIRPALLEGEDFISPPFNMDDEVVAHVMNFLQDRLTHRVDPSQLQIICQHLEQKMIQKMKG
jgi:hypothetical protein